jgi:hypothetical protein
MQFEIPARSGHLSGFDYLKELRSPQGRVARMLAALSVRLADTVIPDRKRRAMHKNIVDGGVTRGRKEAPPVDGASLPSNPRIWRNTAFLQVAFADAIEANTAHFTTEELAVHLSIARITRIRATTHPRRRQRESVLRRPRCLGPNLGLGCVP